MEINSVVFLVNADYISLGIFEYIFALGVFWKNNSIRVQKESFLVAIVKFGFLNLV